MLHAVKCVLDLGQLLTLLHRLMNAIFSGARPAKFLFVDPSFAEQATKHHHQLRIAIIVFFVDFAAAPIDPFFNINTPDDLRRAEALV